MTNTLQLLTPSLWSDYELIDCGGGEKLERFGTQIIARPEPQAIWDKSLSDFEWQKRADATFRRDRSSPDKGEWQTSPDMRDPWYVAFRQEGLNMRFRLSLTTFKHVGIFPEQATNWTYIAEKVAAMTANNQERPRVLNLFAYTGAATLAACQAGADVTHVDAVKPVVNWARDNADASELAGIRWLVEDAVKYARREVRRGNRYNGIILDPPAYGRGPEGEKWVLEDQINDLLKTCAELLDGERFFFIINLYSIGFSSLILDNLIRQTFGGSAGNPALTKLPNAELGELYLDDRYQKRLPLGVFYRFSSV